MSDEVDEEIAFCSGCGAVCDPDKECWCADDCPIPGTWAGL